MVFLLLISHVVVTDFLGPFAYESDTRDARFCWYTRHLNVIRIKQIKQDQIIHITLMVRYKHNRTILFELLQIPQELKSLFVHDYFVVEDLEKLMEDVGSDFLDTVALFSEHERADSVHFWVGDFSDYVEAFGCLLADLELVVLLFYVSLKSVMDPLRGNDTLLQMVMIPGLKWTARIVRPVDIHEVLWLVLPQNINIIWCIWRLSLFLENEPPDAPHEEICPVCPVDLGDIVGKYLFVLFTHWFCYKVDRVSLKDKWCTNEEFECSIDCFWLFEHFYSLTAHTLHLFVIQNICYRKKNSCWYSSTKIHQM